MNNAIKTEWSLQLMPNLWFSSRMYISVSDNYVEISKIKIRSSTASDDNCNVVWSVPNTHISRLVCPSLLISINPQIYHAIQHLRNTLNMICLRAYWKGGRCNLMSNYLIFTADAYKLFYHIINIGMLLHKCFYLIKKH